MNASVRRICLVSCAEHCGHAPRSTSGASAETSSQVSQSALEPDILNLTTDLYQHYSTYEVEEKDSTNLVVNFFIFNTSFFADYRYFLLTVLLLSTKIHFSWNQISNRQNGGVTESKIKVSHNTYQIGAEPNW